MKISFKSTLCVLLTSATLAVSGQEKGINADQAFTDLQSLTGTWRMVTKNATLYESWQKMNDSTYTAKSYKVTGRDTVLLEAIGLVLRGGEMMFIPTVAENQNKSVVFRLLKAENGRYVFENKAHDFPQRIVYNLPQNNMLQASIEGNANGQFKRSDYKFQKVL